MGRGWVGVRSRWLKAMWGVGVGGEVRKVSLSHKAFVFFKLGPSPKHTAKHTVSHAILNNQPTKAARQQTFEAHPGREESRNRNQQ